MGKHEPKTKKEKILARNKKLHIILEAERVHERARQDAKRKDPNQPKMLMGGFSKPLDEEVKLDWRTRAQAARGRVHVAKNRAKSLWQNRK